MIGAGTPTPNVSYSLTHPTRYEASTAERVGTPFSVASISLVRDMELSWEVFQQELELNIALLPWDTLLAVFPEYCWRTTDPRDVFEYLEDLKERVPSDLTLVLGTLEFTLNGKYTNNAIVLSDRRLYFVPKTKALKGEWEQGIVPGDNPGVLALPKFRLGVLVCADLWEASLVHRLVVEEGADLLAVPSWTATRPGFRKWAKVDWAALTRARSVEFSVPIVVADHLHNRPKTDVANACLISDPSARDTDLNTDPWMPKMLHKVSLPRVEEARARWREKGLAPIHVVKAEKIA